MSGVLLASNLLRANADCPATVLPETGELTWRRHFYLPHSSGLCHLMVFRPAASFQDAPVAMFMHGDLLGADYGDAAMTSELFVGKMGNLAEALLAAGYVLITVETPINSLLRHQREPGGAVGSTKILGSWSEVHSLALWPEQPAYLAAAVQYVKSNASGIEGESKSPFGADLWGAGNSIDPGRIVLVGDKWGAQMALYVALQPTGRYPFESELSETTMDPYVPNESHRVRAVVALNPGPTDFTQFYVGPDPLSTAYYYAGTSTAGVGNKWTQPPGTPYYLKGDRFGPFMRGESFRRWSGVKMRFKRQNPWLQLAQGDAENANLAMNIEFEGEGYDAGSGGWDQNLSSGDWSPGTVRSSSATGRAWIQPHDGRIQGEPWATALGSWGADSAAPIRQSVVRYTSSGSAPVLGASVYGASVLAWLQSLGI